MFTHEYKGAYIHGYCDRAEVRVSGIGTLVDGWYRSQRAAKCAITRYRNTGAKPARPSK